MHEQEQPESVKDECCAHCGAAFPEHVVWADDEPVVAGFLCDDCWEAEEHECDDDCRSNGCRAK